MLRRAHVFFLFFFVYLLVSCSGTNSAVAPAPLAEVPSAISLPDPSIGVQEISSQPSLNLKAIAAGTDNLSEEIAIAPNTIGDVNLSFAAVITPFQSIEIPVSTATTQLTASVQDLDKQLAVKMDFAPFDYNGDGQAEPCSGNTEGLPICLRMWVANQPFMAAVFTDYPTTENLGAGSFKILINDSFSGGDTNVRFAYNYDHIDPQVLSTEFFQFTPPESFVQSYRHALISQQGREGSAQKLINFSNIFGGSPGGQETVQYVGQFRQDQDFWSGSLQLSPGLVSPELGNVQNACALISTGDPVLQGACVDLGIDTTGIGFIDYAEATDFTLFDFPATPTF